MKYAGRKGSALSRVYSVLSRARALVLGLSTHSSNHGPPLPGARKRIAYRPWGLSRQVLRKVNITVIAPLEDSPFWGAGRAAQDY
jgi:hypothetical protein